MSNVRKLQGAAVSILFCLSMPVTGAENFINLEVTGLQRSDEGGPLSINEDTDEVVLEADDTDFDLEPGAGLQIGHRSDNGNEYLAGFTYYGNWDATRRVQDADEDIDPLNELADEDSDWTDAFEHSIDYESDLWGAEVMMRPAALRHSHGNLGLDIGVGISHINLEEDFNWNTIDEEGDAPGDNGNSNYRIETQNHLFGVFGELRVTQGLTDNVSINGTARGGMYANFAEQQSVFENDGVRIGRGSNDEVETAGVFDGRIALAFTPMTNASINVGYRGMYLTGVALAPEQVTFGDEDTGSALNNRLSGLNTGNMWLHGPFATFNMRF
ncbi:MAG: hypothetical protein U5P41_09130 [Gammaproteobacteria bacterium]|nr:hypothetical protein [Gammaproteobacteria bacterium]